jgi:phenylpropionate dioxygenase-like ring-hydroxylating dioxygenase large terminal subunit
MRREMLLGEPVLLGRMHDGQAFAMRDICPHRGVPLSAGRILSENTVECPYHGWRFRRDGVCSAIPSLVEGQELDPEKIRVRSYPVREQDGLIWVYVADKPGTPDRAAVRGNGKSQPSLERNSNFSLRHRSCRDRADGPCPRRLCP